MKTLAYAFCAGLILGGVANRSVAGEEEVRGIVVTPAVEESPQASVTAAAEPMIPLLPTPEAAGLLPAPAAGVPVERVVLVGNTVLPEEEVDAILAPLGGGRLTDAHLHDARQALSKLYAGHGYVNSGVLIPDQQVINGIVKLQAVEGSLSGWEIQTSGRLRRGYLIDRVERRLDYPLNVVNLKQSLQRLQADRRIQKVDATLRPGLAPGQSILQLDVQERLNFWTEVIADNYRSPSVDEERVSLSIGHANVTGNGDVLALSGDVTEGMNNYAASYQFPLTAAELSLAGYYSRSDADIVEAPFDRIDISSKTETWGLKLSRPIENVGWLMGASLALEHKRSQSELLGIPFSLAPGEVNGESEASMLRLAMDWLHRRDNSVLALRGTLSFGLDNGETVIDRGRADPNFVAFLGQAHYLRRLDWRNAQASLKLDVQYSPDKLPAFEKMSVGGHATVRGYRENTYVRDNGAVVSAQLSLPMFVDEEGRSRFNLEIAPFFEYGIAWDSQDRLATSDRDEIYSIGVRLQWQPLQDLTFSVSYGHALNDVDQPTNTLQDRGFHAQIRYAVW